MATNNSINANAQGVQYYNGTKTFSGVDASNATNATYVLTSNGTGSAPSFQATVVAPYPSFESNVTLTATQIRGMYVTPVQIVAAPGVGFTWLIDTVITSFTYGGSNVFAGGGTVGVYLNTLSSVIVASSSGIRGTTSYYAYDQDATFNSLSGTGDNQIMTISNVNASYTGNAADDNTLYVSVVYRKLPTP